MSSQEISDNGLCDYCSSNIDESFLPARERYSRIRNTIRPAISANGDEMGETVQERYDPILLGVNTPGGFDPDLMFARQHLGPWSVLDDARTPADITDGFDAHWFWACRKLALH